MHRPSCRFRPISFTGSDCDEGGGTQEVAAAARWRLRRVRVPERHVGSHGGAHEQSSDGPHVGPWRNAGEALDKRAHQDPGRAEQCGVLTYTREELPRQRKVVVLRRRRLVGGQRRHAGRRGA
nr:unnamed protein product [Digitaria exilis]